MTPLIGPSGSGRVVVDGSLIPNPVFGLPTVPIGHPLDSPDGPTQFTGTEFIAFLSDLKPFLQEQFGDPNNTDLSIRNIEVFKQGTGLLAHDFTSPYFCTSFTSTSACNGSCPLISSSAPISYCHDLSIKTPV